MKLTDFLIGKKINVMTDAKVVVQLEVKSIDEKSDTRTIELEPATPRNDWWPKSESYTTHYFLVTFVNGFTKKYNNINEIEIAENKLDDNTLKMLIKYNEYLFSFIDRDNVGISTEKEDVIQWYNDNFE